MAFEVFKTLVFLDSDPGVKYRIDTISYKGQWWLVGSWLQSHATGERTPERLVRLTGLRFQEVNSPDFRFLLNNELPKAVLDGKAQDGYVVLVLPAPVDSPVFPSGKLN